MPEPNTVTAPPDGPDPQDGTTTGWVRVPDSAADAPNPQALGDATVTRTVVSTPGPHHPQRATYSDDTERIRPEIADPARLPVIPGFRIEAVLGHGGMGVVYRAHHLELDKAVALKVIYPRGRDALAVRERFEREVQALAAIEHPNIVPVYHAGDWHGFPYFTMKLIPGGPLSRHLDRFVGKYREIARLMAKVARAVQALHDRKVIHRDLKPLNILVGEGDEPLVADFGLAKWLDDPDSDVSVTGAPLGTRQYMAPEQTLGRRADYSEACDVWAIGVTLYEILSGARPFTDGDTELFDQIQHAAPPPLPPGVPAELAAVVRKCLEKEPADRYATAAAVATDLEAWIAGIAVSVPLTGPEPPRSRGRLVAFGGAGLLALIALPAALMPSPSARLETLALIPPRQKNTAERLRGGETVILTDAKGKPTVDVRDVPGHAVGRFDRVGYHWFHAKSPGLAEFVGDQDGVPLPVRVEAEVYIPGGTKNIPFAGVYAARRAWPGSPVTHQSLVRFVFRPDYDRVDPSRKFRNCEAEAVWWEADKHGIPATMASDSVVLPPAAPGELVFTPLSVEVRAHELTATMGTRTLKPVSALDVVAFLVHRAGEKSHIRLEGFEHAEFGTGIGIAVGDCEAVIRNLKVIPLKD